MKKGDQISYCCNTHDQDTFRLVMQDKGCSLTINDGRTHLITTELTPESMEKLMSGLADIHEALARLWSSVGGLEERKDNAA